MPVITKPFIYEINTAVWLNTLSERFKTRITLANIPEIVIDEITQSHIDYIWFMGVWTRGNFGRRNALKYKHEYAPILPDITDQDIIGSAYAIADYQVEETLGGREGLASLRQRLKARGIGIILDYVPNHVAIDHAWVSQKPGYIINGDADLLKTRPGDFFPGKYADGQDAVFAHGRDPYFSGWSDTAQLNAFNPELRAAVVKTLLDIASQCDGIRCDMAMLLMNSIFEHTWHGLVGPAPEQDYWAEIIPQIRTQHPNFVFIAEVYWDKEFDMLQQGFDYAYDKVLYDRIVEGDASKIRQHLLGEINYQNKMMRFIENHDEPRAYHLFGHARSFATATLICTLPGGTLLHDGQFVGRTAKLPVQITRQPSEPLHEDLAQYYLKLLAEMQSPIYQDGQFYLLEVNSAGTNPTNYQLIAYCWFNQNEYRLIVINMSASNAVGLVNLSAFQFFNEQHWKLFDVTDDVEYAVPGAEITDKGLFISLDAFESHVFRFEAIPSPLYTSR